jgi:hypothetical protein
VLSTRATGECRTLGTVTSLPVVNGQAASFTVTFSGRTSSRTRAADGPVIVHCHADTDFVCTRKVTFDPGSGLVSGPSLISARTVLVYDGIESKRSGLIGRIVRRAASRRSAEAHAEAQRLAARDHEHQILAGFDAALDERLAQSNRRFLVGRLASLLVGESGGLKVAACSTADGFYLGVGGKERAEGWKVPSRQPAAADWELWVHPALFGEEVARFVGYARYGSALSDSLRLMLLGAIPVSHNEVLGIGLSTLGVRATNDWVVVAVPPSKPAILASRRSEAGLQKNPGSRR